MRLTVISHPSVTPVNQELYAMIERVSGWALTLIVPSEWRTEYGRRAAERWPAYRGELVPLPVFLRGNIPLHVYRCRMTRELARQRPDAVYVHHEPYALATLQTFLAAARLREPVPLGFYSAQNIAKRYPLPIAVGERHVMSQASFAFPVSRAVQDVLRGKGYRGRSEVLPLGLNTSIFPDPPGRPSAERSVLGYVGRLSREKGVFTLLEALVKLPETVVVRIAGDGPQAADLREAARALGVAERVEWLGYVPHHEVHQLYASFDLLVVPSLTTPGWKEQFGRVVIESLASRTPVVAADSGELPSLVDSTGGGWIFHEGNAASLAASVRDALSDLSEYQRRATAGWRTVRDQFENEGIARRFVSVVAEAVAIGSRT